MRVSLKKALSESLMVEVHKWVLPQAAYDPAAEVVVLDVSKDLILARSLKNGIEPYGYQVTRRDIVKTLQTDKYLAFRKGELQATGDWATILKRPAMNLEAISTILDSLRELGLLAIVLRETMEEWRSTHCRIENVSEDSVQLRGFDGAGQWEKGIKTVDIADITQVQFGSPYLAFYQGYFERNQKS